MKQTVLHLILATFLSTPILASDYPPSFEFTPMAEHVVQSWDPANETATQLLKEELRLMVAEDACDVITKTCCLCRPEDSNHTKASVAYSLTSYPKPERDEIARLSWGLKRHYGNINKPVFILEIVTAMTSVPNYQRLSIYRMLRDWKGNIDIPLSNYIVQLSKTFTYLELGAMFLNYKTYGIFSTNKADDEE